MSAQPEALRLADDVELNHTFCPVEVLQAAAAELRLLHASCEDYAQHKQRQDQRVLELNAQRDALLEALKEMLEYSGLIEERCDTVTTNKARAAIKTVEGEKT